MNPLRRGITALSIAIVLMLPLFAGAANVFGGKVGAWVPCFNLVSWMTVGAPRGGVYIYSPAFTRTYAFGAPGPGKYVLGLYGIPYFCLEFIAPLYVIPGITMTMVGTSH